MIISQLASHMCCTAHVHAYEGSNVSKKANAQDADAIDLHWEATTGASLCYKCLVDYYRSPGEAHHGSWRVLVVLLAQD